ncbi:MAG TPA: PadR family transcriptional regulator [Conexibacter sp.]|nr:PadR family transcriptional regulator [Conexibacter sp.]
MPLKHAMLALVLERRGYGYELVQRFEQRLGPGWCLNPSAVYPALDQLERDGLVTSVARHSGTRRSPRIVYAPTSAGEATLEAWLRTTDAMPEPVRSDLHLRIAFARPVHHAALAAQLAAHERDRSALLTRYPPSPAAPSTTGRTLVDDAVIAHLRAELAWLAHVRTRIEGAGR